jgi:hypothetical protein
MLPATDSDTLSLPKNIHAKTCIFTGIASNVNNTRIQAGERSQKNHYCEFDNEL